jgi:hypothetical protein
VIKAVDPLAGLAACALSGTSAVGLAQLLHIRSVRNKSRELRELVGELARFAAERNRLGAVARGALPPGATFRT